MIALAIACLPSNSNPTLQNFLQVVRDTASSGDSGLGTSIRFGLKNHIDSFHAHSVFG
jgi:hypothetical protein